DPPMAYVMASQTLDICGKQGEPRLAGEAVTLLTERYDVENSDLITKSLTQVAHTARTGEARGIVAKSCLDLVDQAIAAGKYDAAVELATSAATLAAMEKEPMARDKARDAAERARRAQRFSRDYDAALQKLATTPDDPDANLTAGKSECFG